MMLLWLSDCQIKKLHWYVPLFFCCDVYLVMVLNILYFTCRWMKVWRRHDIGYPARLMNIDGPDKKLATLQEAAIFPPSVVRAVCWTHALNWVVVLLINLRVLSLHTDLTSRTPGSFLGTKPRKLLSSWDTGSFCTRALLHVAWN